MIDELHVRDVALIRDAAIEPAPVFENSPGDKIDIFDFSARGFYVVYKGSFNVKRLLRN